MTIDTWNFPCWSTEDAGPGAPRNTRGMLFATGPPGSGAPTGGVLPFSSEMTSIFSMFIRPGWTSQDGGQQGIFSIGVASVTETVGHSFILSSTTPALFISYKDGGTAAERYEISIGDEDGTNWLQDNKWYQFAVSANSSRIQYVCNGSITPKDNVITNTPGALNINAGAGRVWMTSPPASWGIATDPIGITQNWPSVILGPAMHYSTAIDLSSSTVRDRIFDSNGDFKNPGENGSLWLGDTYDSTIAEYFFPYGIPDYNLGTDTEAWTSWSGGFANAQTALGGLRKQYESRVLHV